MQKKKKPEGMSFLKVEGRLVEEVFKWSHSYLRTA